MTALDPRQELAKRLGLVHVPPPRFESPHEVQKMLAENDYLSDESIASVTFLVKMVVSAGAWVNAAMRARAPSKAASASCASG